MKFLCPNCKAKYQIADEKVGGRTLKMDCRRCGHSIVLRGDQALRGDQELHGNQRIEQGKANPASAVPAHTAPRSAGTRSGATSSASSPPVSAPTGARRPAAHAGSATGRGGSHVGAAPTRTGTQRSALSADFRRNVAAGSSLAVESTHTTPLDQWHVAINDVPVGPMRREEIARKIATGAVTANSLAWREGFDDWRPLRDIPELAALLRQPSAPPFSQLPGARSRGPSSEGAGGSNTQRGTGAAVRPVPKSEATPTAARSRVVPIGGRLGAAAAPAVEEDAAFDEENELESEPTRVATHIDLAAMEAAHRAAGEREVVPRSVAERAAESAESATAVAGAHRAETSSASSGSDEAGRVSLLPDPFPAPPSASPVVAPTPTVSEPVPRTRETGRRELPVGAWIGIAGAMSFGVAMAVMIAPRLLGPEPAAPAPAPPVATVAPPMPSVPREARVTTEVPPELPSQEIPEPTEQLPSSAPSTRAASASADRSSSSGGSQHRRSTGSIGANNTTKAADDAVFDRFRDDGESGTAPIATRPATTEGHGSGGRARGEGLNADQIRNVVAREQRTLQNCWEVAVRGMREVPTVRIDVEVTIGPSGTVTSAHARGPGLGNLSECIERTVLRWRFPQADGPTQTRFPVVFGATG